MVSRSLAPGALLALFLLARGADAPVLAADAESVREIVRRTLSDSSVQRDLPLGNVEMVAGEIRNEATAEPHDGRRHDYRRPYPVDQVELQPSNPPENDPEPGTEPTLGAVAVALLWTTALVGLAFGAAHLFRKFNASDSRGAESEAEATAPANASAMAESEKRDGAPYPAGSRLADADRLAREGRFGEGVHLLLLHAIDHLPRPAHGELPSSLTSREVRGRAGLDEPADEALARLVTVTELSHFGGRPTSESDFRACRERCLRHLVPAAQTAAS